MTAISRRQLLAWSGGLWSAYASPWWARGARAEPAGRPAGIQLYAVRSGIQDDPVRTLEAVRRIGYREVETAGFGKLSARDFRKALDDAGLRCPSAHLQFDAANLGPTFDDAHALGVQYATSGGLRASLHPNIDMSTAMTVEEAKRIAALANRIGARAKEAGLQYAYHNHMGEFAAEGRTVAFDVLLRETDPDLVKFEIDCGWMVLGGGNPVTYLETYPNRFPMIHVKDFLSKRARRTAEGEPEYPGAELGHGIIDYRPIFAAADKAGLQHYFAEQEGPFARMSQLDAAREAYTYLHAMT